MSISLRPATTDDAEACGTICYQAFKALAESHGSPPSFPSVEVAVDRISALMNRSSIYTVVAEFKGQIIGSNIVDERSSIAGIGPLTVDPQSQNKAVGRQLMQHAMDRT